MYRLSLQQKVLKQDTRKHFKTRKIERKTQGVNFFGKLGQSKAFMFMGNVESYANIQSKIHAQKRPEKT